AYLASHIETLEKQLAASANVVKFPDKKCKNCQQSGHLAEECFRKGGGKEGQYPPWWKGKKDVPAGQLLVNIATTPDIVIPEVGELTQYYGLAVMSNPCEGNKIYADTGASDHLFKNRDDFITYS
ncbi:hypothetical protein F5050DRAFT_1532259, partial [Lentinula boryana]